MKFDTEFKDIQAKQQTLGRGQVVMLQELDRIKQLLGVWTCVMCRKEFTSRKALVVHQEAKHPKQWEKTNASPKT